MTAVIVVAVLVSEAFCPVPYTYLSLVEVESVLILPLLRQVPRVFRGDGVSATDGAPDATKGQRSQPILSCGLHL